MSAAGGPEVAVNVDFHARGMWEVPFWNHGARAGYRHLHRGAFQCDSVTAPDLCSLGGELAFSDLGSEHRRVFTYVFQRGACGLLTFSGRDLAVMVLAGHPDTAAELVAGLRATLEAPPAPDSQIAVTYWTGGPLGANSDGRKIDVPGWDEVAVNYPTAVAFELAALVAARRPGPGRLVLWHGEPGTGKTTALRALADAWRDWTAVHYVVDPEALFADARYMSELLLQAGTSARERGRTALLILEDSGELMAPAARQDTGQGLSRLLNLSDGMLGQDLDLLVLITTNEPVGALHPAVSRPGRCAAQVDFRAHTREEANAWLAARGCEMRVRGHTTLAELFALERGPTVQPVRRAMVA